MANCKTCGLIVRLESQDDYILSQENPVYTYFAWVDENGYAFVNKPKPHVHET